MRAGCQALSLLAVPLNVRILEALDDGSLSLIDLRRAAGSPPQTTLRSHLRKLAELDVLERERRNDFPGNVDYRLGRAGRGLLAVAEAVRGWLQASPGEAISLGEPAARGALRALIEGWSSGIVRALAARPLTLTDLNRLIAELNYPSLERRLGAMRVAGQVAAAPGKGRGTPYAATGWLRQAVAPLAVAARWERSFVPERTTPIGRLDVEAAFLLAVPLASLAPDASGGCRLGVEIRRSGHDPRLAGVFVRVEEGRVVSCVSRLQGDAGAWALGGVSAWLRAVIDDDLDSLEIGGDQELVRALLTTASRALFAVPQRT